MKKFLIATILTVFGLLFFVSGTQGATVSDLKQQINDANAEIQAIDREIAKYESQIAETSEEKNTLANIIKELNATRSKLLKEKAQVEQKIKATSATIQIISTNITDREKVIKNSNFALENLIRSLYRSDSTLPIEYFLSSGNLTEASQEYNNIISLNQEIINNIKSTQQEKASLAISKTQKEDEQNKLTELHESLTQKQQGVEVVKKEKDSLLAETKNKEENYKKLLAEQEQKRDAFEKSILQYESEIKFILNPNSLPAPGSQPLDWPLENVFITQLFGVTSSSGRLYRSGSHSGVDFRASVGTPVKAMASGTVIGTGDTDIYCKGASFGKWVFIKYDNGLSTAFGHLSLIFAKEGQKVQSGDVVALSGNTGHSTGPHLHVTVYASAGASVESVPSLSCNGKNFIMPIASKNAYLDPMLYLPQIADDQIKASAKRD